MTHHVFAWAAGFGWTLMPFAPFVMERVPGRPRSIRVGRLFGNEWKRVVATIADDGKTAQLEACDGQAPPSDIVELIQGAAFPHGKQAAAFDHWRIESSVLSVRWPEGFALGSVDESPPPFELAGPDGSLLWLQGPLDPSQLPPLEKMTGPGQTVYEVSKTSGGAMVELQYVHDGVPWRMFHGVVDRYAGAVCLVTGQAPIEQRELVRAAVEEVAASLTPCRLE